jgi:hypothetical protein
MEKTVVQVSRRISMKRRQLEMYEICEEMRFRLGLFVLLLFRLAGLLPHSRRGQAVDVYEASFFDEDEAFRDGRDLRGDEILLGMLGLCCFELVGFGSHRREQVIDA